MHGAMGACRVCNAARHPRSPFRKRRWRKLRLLSGERLLVASLVGSRRCSAVRASIGTGFAGSREASENSQEGTWLLQCSSIFPREELLQFLCRLSYLSKYCPEDKDARALNFIVALVKSVFQDLNHIFCSKRGHRVVHDPWESCS